MTSKHKDILLLLARIMIAIIFIYSGWMKISTMPQTITFFAMLGLPAIFAYVVAYLEFIAGITLALGIFSTASATILGCIMIGAVYITHGGGMNMYGFPLATLAGLLSLIASGPGSFVVPIKKLFKKA